MLWIKRLIMKRILFSALMIVLATGLLSAQNQIIDSVLYINEGTTTIANKAYYGNTEIKYVVIPSSVTTINLLAFHNCTNLKEIDIPASVKTIGNAAFQNDTSLTKVTLHEGLTEINLKTFKNTAISEITIPSSVQKIGDDVFADCKNLTAIYVDKYSDAHACLSADSRVVFTDNAPVRSREEWLTLAKSNILEDSVLYIAEGTTEIKGSAFISRTDIKKVVCPSTLKTINAYAFRYCTNLEEVYLADTKTLMGYVFNGCTSLKKIIVSDSLKAIGNNCIPPTTELIYPEGSWAQEWYEATYYLTVNDAEIPANKYKNKTYKKVTLGSNVTTIGANAFANMEYLEELNMGTNVVKIDNSAFSNCPKITSVVLPNTLTTLGSSVFNGCSSLTSVNLPKNLESIGESCFANTAITKADIPNSVKSVGASAFKGSQIESITFGTGITTIPETVCSACQNLKSVVVKNAEQITANAFKDCPQLQSVTLNEGLTYIGCYAFKNCQALSTIQIPSTVKTIMPQAFANTDIAQCNISQNVSNVSANSFPEGVVPHDVTEGIELKPLNLGISFPTYLLADDKYVVKSMSARVINLERITTITADKGDLNWAYERINFPEWDRDYQCILDILGGGADNYELITNSTGERYIRASVGHIPQGESRTIVVRFKILRTPTEYNGYLSDEPVEQFDEFVAHYLKPSSELGGIVSDSPIFQAIAEEHKSETNSPVELAKLAYLYPWDHIRFEKPGQTLGPLKALELGYGDCTEFAALFITICRASGIPCRHVAVATYGGNEPSEFNGHNHSVAEVYLEPIGWFAVDANLGGGSLTGRHRFGHVTTIQIYMRPEGRSFESYAPIAKPSNTQKYETTWRATEADLGEVHEICAANTRRPDAELAENHPVNGVPEATSFTDEEAMQNIINSDNAPSPEAYETSLDPSNQNTNAGSWKKDEFTTTFTERTWDFSNQIPTVVKQPGSYSIVFTYKSGGHMLVLSNAEIKADGVTVATFEAEKTAGYNPKSISYDFKLNSIPQTLTLTAQARTDGGTNSNGVIELVGGSVSDVIIDSVLYIGTTKTSISSNTYSGRKDFNKVVIPEGVTTISAYAFRNNPNLKEVVLPSTCNTIMGYVFQHCTRLSSINLSNVTSIGNYVFNDCPNLDTITLNEDISKIGDQAFPTSTVIKCIAGGYVYDFVRRNGSEFEIIGYTDEWAEMLKTDKNLIAKTRRSFFTFDNDGHLCECYTTRPLEETVVQQHITRLVINCHGAPPGPELFCNQAIKHLGKQCDNAVIIAPALYNKPYFPSDSPDNAVWFRSGQYLGGVGAVTADREEIGISAYEIIDEMIRSTLTSPYYPNIKEVWVMGLSAGGTTIAHYSIVNVVQNEFPDIKFKYVAKCIPDYVYLSDEREVDIAEENLSTYNNYPYGLGNISDPNYYPGIKGLTADDIVNQFRTRRALFVTGSLDDKIVNDPYAHGDNWVLRNENFRIHLNKVYGKTNRTQFTYIFKGMGHVELGLTNIVQTFLWTDNIPKELIDEMNYEPAALDENFITDSIVFPATVTPTAEQLSEREKQAENYIITPSATYSMGDTRGQGGRSELPVHSETVKSFYIRKYLVTQQEYSDVMGKNKTYSDTEGQKPMMLSWYDACDFCNKLSEKEGFTPCYYIDKNELDPTNRKRYAGQSWLVVLNPDADGYRLPLEAEWEFAARAGTDLLYPGTNGEGPGEGKNGTGVDFYAFYWKNSGDVYLEGLESQWNWNIIGPNNPGTKPVGLKKPNTWGLYDMAGNAKEWCYDWYADNYDKPNETGYYKVLRGGDYRGYRADLRVSARSANQPAKNGAIRLVRSNLNGAEPTVKTSVTELVTDTKIYVYGNTIVIENASDEIFVYDAIGRLIARKDATPCVRAELHVDGAGVYVVKVGSLAKKVIVE